VRRRAPELSLPIGIALCALVVLVLPAGWPLRAAAGIALVLALPGLALTRGAPPVERLLLAVALSVLAAMAASLLLDAVGIPLTAVSWTLLLALPAAGAAYALRGVSAAAPRALPRIRPRDAAALGVGVVLVAGALVLATRPLHAPGGAPGETSVSILAAPDGGATVTARSGERDPARFELTVARPGGAAVERRTVTLRPGEEASLTVPARERTSRLVARVRVGATNERAVLPAP
jgi:hypothetical protein